MAYNKTKVVETAQKYLHQGKIPQAIAEYQSILKQEPKDQVTLMTIGDLYVRQGDTPRAVEYFERLAQIFLQDGFTTKAIAIYKKVAKLAPEEGRALEKLAELYVQQGVLSEARPIFLQLAEMHIRNGKQPQAAALLKRLLEAEPDNLRVHVRLAELHLSMDQQKDAIEIFLGAAQRVLDRGDQAEAGRLAERILQLDPANKSAMLFKVRALSAAGKGAEAVGLLEPMSKQDSEGESTKLLFEQYLANGQSDKAAALAEQMFARNAKNYAPAQQLAATLLDSGDLERAQHLFGLIRNAVTEAGEQEQLARNLSRLADGSPRPTEPLEWLVEHYTKKNDAAHLSGAQVHLARAFAAAGDNPKALEIYEQLLSRTPMDAVAQREYANLRSAAGLQAAPNSLRASSSGAGSTPAPLPTVRPEFNEETERYVTQALTDVDLFSSYGLTQKAVDLLEDVLRRAPYHVASLERLLDLSVGAGNEHRTVELASTLEQLAAEAGDDGTADRYAELRRRFQRASGGASPARPSAPEPAAPPVTSAVDASAPPVVAATPIPEAPEFVVPVIDAELVDAIPLDDAIVDAEPEAAVTEPEPVVNQREPIKSPAPMEAVVHEVDLSLEWAALSQQMEESAPAEAAAEPQPVSADAAEQKIESADVAESPVLEPILEDEAYELELQPQAVSENGLTPAAPALSADELFSDLAHELESATASLHEDMRLAAEHAAHKGAPAERAPAPAAHAEDAVPPAHASVEPVAGNGMPANGASAGPLGDLFDQFRTEMGDSGAEQEDPETHYNLGIAYREMGLLDEAIGEFQKVYKGDKTQAFRYAMQCCTLLALAFREKGQPAIAAMWYERALLTPGLDQESILALRYDLGIAQEMAGDTAAAFKSFSQVYAMNIDYRDVAERVALLGKAR